MRAQATAQLDADGIAAPDRTLRLSADLRYKGQAFELTVPWGDSDFDTAGIAAVSGRFHELHQKRFSYANHHDAIEIVTLRLSAIGHLRHPSIVEPAISAMGRTASKRRVFVTGAWHEIELWRRDQIGGAARVYGPAIIEEDYTTIFLAPGWTLERGAAGHLVANCNEASP